MSRSVRLSVNGDEREISLVPDRTLLSVLREELGLTGAKYGCGEGECGACTVLVDGSAARACRSRIGEVAGCAVTTIEGLAPRGRLHPVQRAFAEIGAMQCGFCTPGMIIGTVALLAANPEPDEWQIRSALDGNVCRCCAYPAVLRAVERASELLREDDGSAWAEPPRRDEAPAAGMLRPAEPWDLLKPEERDYFEVLSDGLVVVGTPELAAQVDAWSAGGGAWIHVGADDVVTAFTGKVDVGQDNRTALSQLVAEELHVPIESVHLVMGDTGVCPFDEGTFGSRSTPDAGEVLRATAAAARELLVAAAAERWDEDPSALVAAGGSVSHRDGRSIAYGDLVRGMRRVETTPIETPISSPTAWRTAGAPTGKVTTLDTVTGARRYPSDLAPPGLLHGAILRRPAFGAVLRSVDVTRARAVPGVTVVHEGSFVGAAAPDASAAHRSIQAVSAEWDLSPQPSEDGLVAHLRSHPIEGEGWGGPFHHEAGDPDAALAASPVRLAETYTTAYIAHVPLETRVALAIWEGERLTVWTGTQRPFGVREELANALDVPEAHVRVIVPDTGGGYGGKHTGEVAIEAARLARAAGRPVKVRWTREEEFAWAYFRPAAVIDVRSAAGADAVITAWEFTNINAGAAGILSPYEIPNQRIDYRPADSPLRQGSYRALAATANHFGRESHMDELAHRLGVDPLELRLRHLRDDRLAHVLTTVADRAGWSRRPLERGHGIGLACGVEKDGRVATCVEVLVKDARPEVVRITTAFECGAIVNPDNLVNQIEGATAMGLGGALFEAVHFEDGRILNGRLSGYRVPRFTDVPPIDVVLIDRRDLPSAGAGETPIVAVAPAIANAIFDATGVRIRSMPIAPDGRV